MNCNTPSGVLLFPKDYPYKPPSVLMYTPNGRFQERTRLCLSMSDFHPGVYLLVFLCLQYDTLRYRNLEHQLVCVNNTCRLADIHGTVNTDYFDSFF